MGQHTLGGSDLSELRSRYRRLIEEILPQAAQEREGWPVHRDHCFARIILDDTFDDAWYDHVEGRPAYEHLSPSELREAIETAERLLKEGAPLVRNLNQASLRYREDS